MTKRSKEGREPRSKYKENRRDEPEIGKENIKNRKYNKKIRQNNERWEEINKDKKTTSLIYHSSKKEITQNMKTGVMKPCLFSLNSLRRRSQKDLLQLHFHGDIEDIIFYSLKEIQNVERVCHMYCPTWL